MNINTTKSTINHAESILTTLRSSNDLPFQDVLSPDEIYKHIASIPHRSRIFTPELTIFAFLSQVIAEDQSCQAAVAQVIAHFAKQEDEVSANTAGYCKARSRLPEEVLSGLTRESAEQLEGQTPLEWLWRERHVKLIDGSCISMPDTPENQATYPQPDAQNKGVGFPLSRIVAVISLATGAALDLAPVVPAWMQGTGKLRFRVSHQHGSRGQSRDQVAGAGRRIRRELLVPLSSQRARANIQSINKKRSVSLTEYSHESERHSL